MTAPDGGEDALLEEYLKSALLDKLQHGNVKLYESVVKEVSRLAAEVQAGREEGQGQHLSSLLDALTSHVSLLNEREHDALLTQVLGVSCWVGPQELRVALLSFLTHLVVARGSMLHLILRTLVHNFLPPRRPSVPGEEADTSRWRADATAVAVLADVVATLKQVLRLVPTAGTKVADVIARGVPHKLRDRESQCLYLRAVYALAEAEGTTAIREELLAVAVEHLISLDVEIRWQDIALVLDKEDEEEEEEEEEVDMFELEGQTQQLHLEESQLALGKQSIAVERVVGRGGWEGQAADPSAMSLASPSGRPQARFHFIQLVQADEMAAKLDALMELTLAHLEARVRGGQVLCAWDSLMRSFFATILPTHRSKFTQYLVWFLADKDPDVCGRSLVEKLLEAIMDAHSADISRSASAAYLASFLARAAYVPEGLLVEALQRLAQWCLAYCAAQDRLHDAQPLPGLPLLRLGSQPPAPSPAMPSNQGLRHQVFYAAAQSLLYVLCYRLEQLMVHGSSEQAQAMRQLFQHMLPPLLGHRLAPLEVCLPTVVLEFTGLAARLGLMDCTALLPTRAAAARAQRPLEIFFPFDPYLLRYSAEALDLTRTYLRWKQGHPRGGPAEGPDVYSAVKGATVDRFSDESSSEEESSSSSDEEGESSLASSENAVEEEGRDGEADMQSSGAAPSRPGWLPTPIGRVASLKRVRKEAFGSSAEGLGAGSLSTNEAGSPLGMSWTPSLNQHHELPVNAK